MWSLIFEAPELKKYKNLIQYNGNWFKEVFSESGKSIIYDLQKPGIIYLVVNTTKNNLYCDGSTKKIKVTLN
ncbi:hypothetical protein SAP269_22020 (plasmid) [Spiroplasma ixodetis]|uniref:Uncharacterized protein n=1 Tax=Spiroplasma ixodetis TaxID=2141 RepID=A0ABM8JT52_9MOLU